MDTIGVTGPSLDWYKKFFDYAAVGMVISDDEFRFVEVNLAFCEMLEYTREELLKKSIFEVTHKDDVRISSEKLTKQFVGKISSFHLEKRYVRKDGKIVWGSVTTMSFPSDEKGGSKLSFAVIEDITRQKKLQEDLLNSEGSYRGLFDSVNEAVYIQDSEGKFLDVNKGAVKMYGHPKEWFIGKSPLDVSASGKNDMDKIGRLVGEAYKGEPQEFEFWGVRSNGEVFPKEVRVYKGKYFGKNVVIALATDITVRKQADLALAEAKARLEAILEGIGEGIMVVDNFGKIIVYNRVAQKISGYKFEEVVSRNFWEIVTFTPEGLSHQKSDFVRRTLSEKKLSEASAQLLSQKNGGKVLVSASAAPVIGKNRNLLGVVVVFRDITKLREVERMRDDFMMIASHELRAPMTAIKWLVASLLEGTYGSVPEPLKTPLFNVATSTDRLIHLVNDMIGVTRLESGGSKLVISNFDIKPLITNLLEIFGVETKRKNIRIVTDGISSAMVHADSDGLMRIFSNLVDNALKFTNEGGVITLTMKSDPEFLTIFVEDTGVGIPGNFVDKLFVKFGQIRSKIDGKPVGTGLGLYISRELARNMGGDLWLVRSEVGKGSVFGIKMLK